MMRVPTISVVISVRGNEDDLVACRDSIAAQTHRRLEVIEADDRNRGLEMATGEFLAFVDGDFALPANAYELLLQSLEYTGSDFASAFADIGSLDRTHISKTPELLYDVSAGSKLFRRSFWDLHRLRYREGPVWADTLLMTTAHVLAKKIDVLPDAISLRRERARDRGSVAGLRDQMSTLASIDTLLATYGPAKLLRAHQAKALTNDLWHHVRDLHKVSQAYRAEFCLLAAPYLDTVSPKVIRRLPAPHKLAYQLIHDGALPELARYAHWLTRQPGDLVTTGHRLRQGRRGFAERSLGEVGHAFAERRERREAEIDGGRLG